MSLLLLQLHNHALLLDSLGTCRHSAHLCNPLLLKLALAVLHLAHKHLGLEVVRVDLGDELLVGGLLLLRNLGVLLFLVGLRLRLNFRSRDAVLLISLDRAFFWGTSPGR